MDGTLVHPKTYEQINLREDILATLRRIKTNAEKLGSTSALDHIYQITHKGSDAAFLRRVQVAQGSVESMVDASLKQFRYLK